jgi:hypothetical protein
MLFVAWLGCESGPRVEGDRQRSPSNAVDVTKRVSRIHYEMGGLAADGAQAWRVDIDLDHRAIVTSLWKSSAGSGAESRKPLSDADAEQLRKLAGCAHAEPPGQDPRVNDLSVTLVLEGETRREIKHSGPMTAPCAKQLQEQIEKLAPWP